MKTISLSVSESDYEHFQQSARSLNRSTAHLIREAMAFYREERLSRRERLTDLPLLAGHRPVTGIPGRTEIYSEIFEK